MAYAVFGTVATRTHAEEVVSRLRQASFPNRDISVLMPDSFGPSDLRVDNQTKLPEGATVGGGSGAVLGGVLGWLAGIGMLAIPGLGPFIAAGPIMAALGGAAVGGAVGGLSGALIGMGMPEYEAQRYEQSVKSGRALISVHAEANDQRDRAKKILEEAGAQDIATSTEPSTSAY